MWQWLSKESHPKDSEPPAPSGDTPQIAKEAANRSGNPIVAMVGPECPNKENLFLGRNNVFREAILEASRRLGLIPQAICALIDCEAGKVTENIPQIGPGGKKIADKKGRQRFINIRELWNANAANEKSGAAGLTQFLASTWLDHVLRQSLYIQEQSAKKGWVREEIQANGKRRWVFVLTNNKTTVEPHKHQDDENVKHCLAMRLDPSWSINAAADYGNLNLKLLIQQGFKLGGLNDMEKAKLMYLMHHEGEGAGPAFIRNKLGQCKGGVDALKKKFITQLGKNGAALVKEKIDDANGNIEMAYRRWLADFIDKNFRISPKYFCSQPSNTNDISSIFVTIGGEAIK